MQKVRGRTPRCLGTFVRNPRCGACVAQRAVGSRLAETAVCSAEHPFVGIDAFGVHARVISGLGGTLLQCVYFVPGMEACAIEVVAPSHSPNRTARKRISPKQKGHNLIENGAISNNVGAKVPGGRPATANIGRDAPSPLPQKPCVAQRSTSARLGLLAAYALARPPGPRDDDSED